MKKLNKPPKKLVLDQHTIRALASSELVQAVGGMSGKCPPTAHECISIVICGD